MTDEQTALLKEIRDLLASANEATRQRNEKNDKYIETTAARGEKQQQGVQDRYDQFRGATVNGYRILYFFGIVIIILEALILMALTK